MEVTAQSGDSPATLPQAISPEVIETKQVENLALNGGNYLELMTLVPGAVVTNPDQFSVTTSTFRHQSERERQSQRFAEPDRGWRVQPGRRQQRQPDEQRQFELHSGSQNPDVECGRRIGRTAGVSFNVVTKNGTNQFHGSTFETFRNDDLDARNFFSVTKTQAALQRFRLHDRRSDQEG